MNSQYIVRELDRDGRNFELYGPFTTHASASKFADKMEATARRGHAFTINSLVPASVALASQEVAE